MPAFPWGHRRHGSIRLTDAVFDECLVEGDRCGGSREAKEVETGVRVEEQEEEEESYGELEREVKDDAPPRASRKQMALIYSFQLAEAIVAASLQPQLYMALRDSEHCTSINSAYWAGVVEAVFALGSIAGLGWGKLGDRFGRRSLALFGMFGLSISCIAMGFSTGAFACMLIRAFAGLMSSSIRVALAAMLGDVSETKREKARNFAKLPLVATGGVVGPLLQAALAHRFSNDAFWKRYPLLSSQLACATLMMAVFVINVVWLKETLPRATSDVENSRVSVVHRRDSDSSDEYEEKDAFLGQSGQTSPTRPQPIKIAEIVRAPSLLILLLSFSLLLLHSASFDQLLPLLGNSETGHGGLGLPCSFIPLVVLFANLSAGIVIALTLDKTVESLGLIRLYQVCCWAFPALYILTPLLSGAAEGTSRMAIILSSGLSIFSKTLVTGCAQTLVLVLVTSASPDAFSLATIMGVMQSASVLRSLAVGGTGVAFYLSDDLSLRATNYGLWATMAVIGFGGAAVAHFVRDHPTVRDYSSSLKWEVCYESTEEPAAYTDGSVTEGSIQDDESVKNEEEDRGNLGRWI
ncbi:MFS general substrate transporter [Ascodesmis nigricans]|uniref:MFS general substrate transporter n=1 Tax=Ascodesmis nigricans TaxID=341454 RepID=A0A4S2MWF1_9PEZI|nr:MFS general substrate transporter [Ascodesmis nigricans]